MKRIIESYWVKILSQILYQLKNKATNIFYLRGTLVENNTKQSENIANKNYFWQDFDTNIDS